MARASTGVGEGVDSRVVTVVVEERIEVDAKDWYHFG